jgi:hypothetical protein
VSLAPDISQEHSAFISSGKADQENIANTGRVAMVSKWPEGWLSQAWKGPVCVTVALTKDIVRCYRET